MGMFDNEQKFEQMQLQEQSKADLQKQILNQPSQVPLPDLPDQDFFKYRIDGTDILEEVQHQLKGEVYVSEWDTERKKHVGRYKKMYDSWLNDEGLNKVLHIIYSCGINKNTLLGNMTTDQINFKCQKLKKNLALLLFKNYQKYHIDKEMRSLLITTVVNTVHSGLSRSEGGKEADQLSSATQRHEIYHQEGEKKNQNQERPRFSLFKR